MVEVERFGRLQCRTFSSGNGRSGEGRHLITRMVSAYVVARSLSGEALDIDIIGIWLEEPI